MKKKLICFAAALALIGCGDESTATQSSSAQVSSSSETSNSSSSTTVSSSATSSSSAQESVQLKFRETVSLSSREFVDTLTALVDGVATPIKQINITTPSVCSVKSANVIAMADGSGGVCEGTVFVSNSQIPLKINVVKHKGECTTLEGVEMVKVGNTCWTKTQVKPASGGVCNGNLASPCPDSLMAFPSWAAAMKLSDDANTKSMTLTYPHQGACPKGSHVPDNVDMGMILGTTTEANNGYYKLLRNPQGLYTYIAPYNIYETRAHLALLSDPKADSAQAYYVGITAAVQTTYDAGYINRGKNQKFVLRCIAD
jgi:hypothetical protein